MVDDQIAARGIRDGDVLDALRSAPRHLFVPDALEHKAYVDAPLSIGHGQTISQPYMVALMTELLRSTCAVACWRSAAGAGTRRPCSPSWRARSTRSSGSLRSPSERAHCSPAWPTKHPHRHRRRHARLAAGGAPFDRILVAAAAAEKAPPALIEQLADGGRLVIPHRADPPRDQTLTVFERNGGQHHPPARHACRFVPLLASAESGRDVRRGGPGVPRARRARRSGRRR